MVLSLLLVWLLVPFAVDIGRDVLEFGKPRDVPWGLFALVVASLPVVAVGAVLSVMVFVFMFFGKESIVLTGDSLTIRRSVGPVGSALRIDEIQAIRAYGYFGDLMSVHVLLAQMNVSGGVVEARTAAKTYRFGAGLEEDQAIAIVHALQRLQRPESNAGLSQDIAQV